MSLRRGIIPGFKEVNTCYLGVFLRALIHARMHTQMCVYICVCVPDILILTHIMVNAHSCKYKLLSRPRYAVQLVVSLITRGLSLSRDELRLPFLSGKKVDYWDLLFPARAHTHLCVCAVQKCLLLSSPPRNSDTVLYMNYSCSNI